MDWERWLKKNSHRVLQEFGHDEDAPAQQQIRQATGAPAEHEEQVRVFEWAAENEERYPQLRYMFAIPNGGHRHPAVAAKLKAEGVKSGVPDICLPCPRKGRHGLFIEMKRADKTNHTTDEQDGWLIWLRVAGYAVVVAYGADAAIEALENYLSRGGSGDGSAG